MAYVKSVLLVLMPIVSLSLGCKGEPAGGTPDSGVPRDAGPDAAVGHEMAVGELYEVPASGSGSYGAALATPAGTETFIALLHSRAEPISRLGPYTARISASPPRRSARTALRHRSLEPEVPIVDDEWGCLSAGGTVSLSEVAERLAGLPVPRGQLSLPAPPPPPLVGEMIDFEVGTRSGKTTVTAEVLLVSAETVIVVDRTTDPGLTLDGSQLAEIADAFDTIVMPRERIFFGQESDVNADGHITVLFTPLVVTESGASAYVNPYDLITDPGARPAAAAANDQELLYVGPPSLLPAHMQSTNALVETLAHEFQHAIYFYRKYILNSNLVGTESPYITEGLSALAQDLTGYQAGNFFVSMAGLTGMDAVSANDLILNPSAIFPTRDGELRGAAYNLLRFFYDQAGGDVINNDGSVDLTASPGIAWLRAFVDAPELGRASLERATGQTYVDAIHQWLIAQMVSNRTDDQSQPLSTDVRYNYLPTTVDPLTGRTRGTDMFGSFATVQKTGPRVVPLASSDEAIRLGGADYLEFTAVQAGITYVEVTADASAVDVKVTLLRTR